MQNEQFWKERNMTKREQFALEAMKELIRVNPIPTGPRSIAEKALTVSDLIVRGCEALEAEAVKEQEEKEKNELANKIKEKQDLKEQRRKEARESGVKFGDEE